MSAAENPKRIHERGKGGEWMKNNNRSMGGVVGGNK